MAKKMAVVEVGVIQQRIFLVRGVKLISPEEPPKMRRIGFKTDEG